jgi:hypothetical protein
VTPSPPGTWLISAATVGEKENRRRRPERERLVGDDEKMQRGGEEGEIDRADGNLARSERQRWQGDAPAPDL